MKELMRAVDINKSLFDDNLNTFKEMKGIKYLKIKNKIEIPKVNNTNIDVFDKLEYSYEKNGSKSWLKIKMKSKIIKNIKQE